MTGRRDFLKTAGALAVYKLAEPAAQAAQSAAPGDAVRVGFIGVGIRGSQLVDEFKTIAGVQIPIAADLYDGYLQHAQEAIGDSLAVTKRYEDVIARKDLDAVVIATPDHWHKRMVLDALSAGKHVYIEKPMTWSLKEGPELIAAEKKSGKVLQVGSGTKTSAMTAKVKEVIASGALGNVRMIRMVNHRNNAEGAWVYPIPPDASEKTIDWPRFLGPAPKRAFSPEVFFRWRCWWEYSGGVATDLFVHLLTTLHEFMGVRAPVSAVSQGGLFRWKDGRAVPDLMESVFEYKEGFLAQMCVNLSSTARAPYAVIQGEKGSLFWENSRVTLYAEPADRDVQHYGTNAWPKAMRDAYLKSKENVPASERPQPQEIKVERGMGHAEFFIDSIRNNKPSRENATEGHAAAGAAHLANRAYREGKKLRWDFETNKVMTA
jgi:predicted dehydrogenase